VTAHINVVCILSFKFCFEKYHYYSGKKSQRQSREKDD